MPISQKTTEHLARVYPKIHAAMVAANALQAVKAGFRNQLPYDQQVALMREAVNAADAIE